MVSRAVEVSGRPFRACTVFPAPAPTASQPSSSFAQACAAGTDGDGRISPYGEPWEGTLRDESHATGRTAKPAATGCGSRTRSGCTNMEARRFELFPIGLHPFKRVARRVVRLHDARRHALRVRLMTPADQVRVAHGETRAAPEVPPSGPATARSGEAVPERTDNQERALSLIAGRRSVEEKPVARLFKAV